MCTFKSRNDDRHIPDKIKYTTFKDESQQESSLALPCIYTLFKRRDIQVAEILHHLNKEGLTNNTVVIFMGDNGADLFRGMDWLYDAGIHVPLIIRWPGQLEQGMVNNHLISSLDELPLFYK